MFLVMFIFATVVISISICCCFRVTLALGEMMPIVFLFVRLRERFGWHFGCFWFWGVRASPTNYSYLIP